MVMLPHLDIFEICFNFQKYSNYKKVFNVLYNTSSEVCFTKNYIDLLEKEVSNKDAFEALVRELHDTNRIKIENTSSKKSCDEEFIEIASNAKVPLLIPIINEDLNNYTTRIPFLTIAKKAIPINRHWIALELLSNNFCNVSYQDFKNDAEIASFIKNVFSIPKYIRNITVFDRDQNTTILSVIKGLHINYFTFLRGGKQNEYYRKQVKKDLQKALGGKLKLYYTNNPRQLHERKIIFEDILITIDNAHINLTVAEPTWEIFINYNKEKSANWKAKCNCFCEVNN
jgi:hypothetical protein